MTKRELWAAKREEYDALKAKIAVMPQGAVRVGMKRKLMDLSGVIVNLRQECIREELAKPDPQFIPRESFGLTEPQPEDSPVEEVTE